MQWPTLQVPIHPAWAQRVSGFAPEEDLAAWRAGVRVGEIPWQVVSTYPFFLVCLHFSNLWRDQIDTDRHRRGHPSAGVSPGPPGPPAPVRSQEGRAVVEAVVEEGRPVVEEEKAVVEEERGPPAPTLPGLAAPVRLGPPPPANPSRAFWTP